MGKEIEKEPDFYPFRIKDHGWVLKKGVSTETIGEAFKDMVYELVTKDFTPGSIAESMHNDALTMIEERAEKARKAAKTRWQKAQEGAANGNNADESATACVNNKGRSPDVEGSARYPGSAWERPKNLGSSKPSTDGGTSKYPLNMTTVRKNGKLESRTSVENICGSAKTQAASNTGNVKPVTCRESGNLSEVTAKEPLAGGMLPSSSLKPSASSGSVDVLNLAYAGEFGNVRLTQEQYAQLGIKFGNQQKLNRAIDSLSCLIENGEKNPQNHYAELVKWANYRDDMDERKEEEASKPKMTEMEKSWIAAMKRVEAM